MNQEAQDKPVSPETPTDPAADLSAADAVEAATGTAAQPETVTISSAELKKLQDGAAQAEALRDQLLRTKADADNYRKRLIREKEEAVKYAAESVLEKLLPILDSFEMGLQAAQKATDAAAIAQGMQMVQTQLQSLLKELGVETIDAVGQPFDPHRHEALAQQDSAEHEEGTVLGQMRKGYKLKDRLLRPASVFVSKKPEGAEKA